MKIAFQTRLGCFNYRVYSDFIQGQELLVMKDERTLYHFLLGGRVALHETAEDPFLRELREELEMEGPSPPSPAIQPALFTEDVSGGQYHVPCLYSLTEISRSGLPDRGKHSVLNERGRHRHTFTWMPFEELVEQYRYPIFG